MSRPAVAIALALLAIPAAALAVTLDSWAWLAAQVIMQVAALALTVDHQVRA